MIHKNRANRRRVRSAKSKRGFNIAILRGFRRKQESDEKGYFAKHGSLKQRTYVGYKDDYDTKSAKDLRKLEGMDQAEKEYNNGR